MTLSGVLSGSGGLTKAGSGSLTLQAANTFTGTTTISGGTLLLGNVAALASSTLDTSGAGTLSFGTLTSATLGGLQGTNGLALSNTHTAAVALTVGGNGQSTTYSGNLSGRGSLTKAGPGTLTLTGATPSPAAPPSTAAPCNWLQAAWPPTSNTSAAAAWAVSCRRAESTVAVLI